MIFNYIRIILTLQLKKLFEPHQFIILINYIEFSQLLSNLFHVHTNSLVQYDTNIFNYKTAIPSRSNYKSHCVSTIDRTVQFVFLNPRKSETIRA